MVIISTFYFGTDQIWIDYHNFEHGYAYLCPTLIILLCFHIKCSARYTVIPFYSTTCYTTTSVAREAHGPWLPKYIISVLCPPCRQFYKKVVVRLSEHGDVIQTQTLKVCRPQRFLPNSVAACSITFKLWSGAYQTQTTTSSFTWFTRNNLRDSPNAGHLTNDHIDSHGNSLENPGVTNTKSDWWINLTFMNN